MIVITRAEIFGRVNFGVANGHQCTEIIEE